MIELALLSNSEGSALEGTSLGSGIRGLEGACKNLCPFVYPVILTSYKNLLHSHSILIRIEVFALATQAN